MSTISLLSAFSATPLSSLGYGAIGLIPLVAIACLSSRNRADTISWKWSAACTCLALISTPISLWISAIALTCITLYNVSRSQSRGLPVPNPTPDPTPAAPLMSCDEIEALTDNDYYTLLGSKEPSNYNYAYFCDAKTGVNARLSPSRSKTLSPFKIEVLVGDISRVAPGLAEQHTKLGLQVAANPSFPLFGGSRGQAGAIFNLTKSDPRPHKTAFGYLDAQYKARQLGINPYLETACRSALATLRKGIPATKAETLFWHNRAGVEAYLKALEETRRTHPELKGHAFYETAVKAIGDQEYALFYYAALALHAMKDICTASNSIGLFSAFSHKVPQTPYYLFHTAAPNFNGDWRLEAPLDEACRDDALIRDSIYSATYKSLEAASDQGLEALVLTPTGVSIFIGRRAQLISDRSKQMAPYAEGLVQAAFDFQKNYPDKSLKVYLSLFSPGGAYADCLQRYGLTIPGR